MTKCEVKMAGYWPSSIFWPVYGPSGVRWINSQKKKGKTPSHLVGTNYLVNKGFIIWLSGKFLLRDIVGSPERGRFGSSWLSEWRLSPGEHECLNTLGENNKTNNRNNAPSRQKTTAAPTWLWLWWQIELQPYNKCCSSNKAIETRAKVWVNNEYYRNPSRI